MTKKIAFDIGSCLGESIPRFKDYDEIYAFEPSPWSHHLLYESNKNDSRIKFFQLAVSDVEDILPFYRYDHYGYSSLYKINKDGEMGKWCEQIDPGYDQLADIIEVKSIRLDNFMSKNDIDHIDFLKIDTQGNDLNVIKSLGNMISNVDTIELEVQVKPLYYDTPSKKEILDFMSVNNFSLISEKSNGAGLESYEEVLTFKNNNKEHMIPVIGTAVVNSAYWVSRLLMSIDYPTENFIIINNNGRGELDEELNALSKIKHKYVKNIKVCNLPGNIGCSGAWNLIIKSNVMSPYWIITNDDVAFCPGFLNEMVSTAESDADIGIIHGYSGDFNVGSWDLFLIRDHIIQKFGIFDENLYPAYCEDADYIMRFQHQPIKRVTSLNSNYYHGNGLKEEYYTKGSQTKKTDPTLNEKLIYSNDVNIEYLTEKWGPNWRTCSPEDLPFKNKNHSIKETTYDLEFIRKKHLGF